MSDQSPPPKPKPGSLRDRIAAFENKGSSSPPQGPPVPRPKPGGLQWKPRPPSPSSPDHVQSGEHKPPPNTGGTSTSDAMETIGRGGSLRERMAALQGKGGFGGGAPPPVAPKPTLERPKWKPPPTVSDPDQATSGDESKNVIAGINLGGREASRSPPPRAAVSPPPESQGTSNREGDSAAQEGDRSELDPEEEERQRRAAIAARMARLGGARFGMGPPIFTPKPVAHKPDPAPPPPEVKEDTSVDQPAVLKESGQASVTSPPHDPATESYVPEPTTESERNDELESVPARAPTSMPVPVGPRRAAPPRKKVSKNAPTTALPEPPVEEAEALTVHSLPVTDEPSTSADHDALPATTANAEQSTIPPPAFIEASHDPVRDVNITEGSGGQDEEATDDRQVSSEKPREVLEAEEDEETRRHRVAAKLAQMGAFNPLSGPPPVPRRLPLDEQTAARFEEPLDVEDELNVDTEEYRDSLPPQSAVLARPVAAQPIEHDAAEPHLETDQDDGKPDEDAQVPAHRDGEHTVASYTEEQGDVHNEHIRSAPEFSDERPRKHHVPLDVAEQEHGIASSQKADASEISDTAPPEVEKQEYRRQGDTDDTVARGAIAKIDNDNKDEAATNEVPLPSVAQPSLPPPPVNFQSKPTTPSSPPLSPLSKRPVRALKVDEERPASPDIPPRPVPPPGRSGSVSEDGPSPPPRRTLPPPPPRRTSVRMTDAVVDPPSSPPTSPRPVNRPPPTPPIITRLGVQEQVVPEVHEKAEHYGVEELSERAIAQPGGEEDEASAPRLAIAERMARLGGIRFGAPPLMNPLSRPPLPAAPPPTSIPPDEIESEEKEEGTLGEGDEDESARKQRIAAKLAGMGGMRLGMLPPAAGLPPALARRPVAKQEDSEGEDAVLPVPVPAPPQRRHPTRVSIEQALGKYAEEDSHQTSNDGVRIEAEEGELRVRYSDALASEEEGAPALPPARRASHTRYSAEALPTPPPRMTSRSPPPVRPPIPAGLLGRRPSAAASVSGSRHGSVDEASSPPLSETPTTTGHPQSEYVMVEVGVEDPDEDDTPITQAPPPRRKSTRGAVNLVPLPPPPPPPPSAIDPPEVLTSSVQWDIMPSIPQGQEGGEGSEMASSGWSEDSTAVHVPTFRPGSEGPVLSPESLPSSRSASGKLVTLGSDSRSGSISGSGLGTRSVDHHQSQQQPQRRYQQEPTADELMAIWGKVGVRVVEAATTLFEKSKRALVGDGSYAGFVRAVLAQVPGVVLSPGAGHVDGMDEDGDGDEWGYAVYAQTGNAVQRRASDILPGDVITFRDAKLKGHKGLHSYTQTVGGGGAPFVGVVSEFDTKKSKVRVWQANQHVGQQTVEIVSYRLDDLKNGQVKVYRVLEA